MTTKDGKIVFLKRQLRRVQDTNAVWESINKVNNKTIKSYRKEIARLKAYIKELRANGSKCVAPFPDPSFQECYERTLKYFNDCKTASVKYKEGDLVWSWKDPKAVTLGSTSNECVAWKVVGDDLEFVEVKNF